MRRIGVLMPLSADDPIAQARNAVVYRRVKSHQRLGCAIGGDAVLPWQARTHHFALHVVIELDPSFFHLWSKCSAKLLFQAPYQRIAKRSEVQWLRPELCVLATRMANDRLEHFALVERTNNGSDHVHQFEVLPFHVASEQALRIRSEFKKSAVKLVSELSTDRPDRVERLSDKLSLFRRHDANRRYQKSAREAA